MSLFVRRDWAGMTASEHITRVRSASASPVASVTSDTAMRHSAVWACLRLRANLISTMPVDAYRKVDDVQVEVPKPPVLMNPGGERVDIQEWLYSTQVDLDRGGNTFGIITERNGMGLPARIDLVNLAEASVIVKGGNLSQYRLGGQLYDPRDVWHEKQYTISGLHVGLSPVAYAAWTIGEYLSIQQFALDWFGNSTTPAVHLKNTGKTITDDVSAKAKAKYKASVQPGDVFVTGADWELKPIQANEAASQWIEGKQYSISDVARFFDCPGDVIDAAVQSGNITYANITQRNLQLLIHNVGPAVARRERALSKLLPAPRFVKLNSDALLRMDPQTRAEMGKTLIESKQRVPSELRALDNLPPFTEEQFAEMERIFGSPRTQPTTATGVSA